jgi:2-keto-4-pentenoate hydratase
MPPIDGPKLTSQAALLLLQSRQTGARLACLPPELTPRTLEEAYQIQGATLREIADRAAGYKLGLTSAAGQKAVGVGHPISGRVLSTTIRDNGAVIPARLSRLRAVEAEIAFTTGTAFSPRSAPYSLAEVIAGISAVTASLEICDSRFVDCDVLPFECIVADNANAAALVMGDRLQPWTPAGLDDMPVTLYRNDVPVAVGTTHNVLGNPLNALLWLVNWLSARGEPLQRGQVVSAGTCTGVTLGAAGDRFKAQFGVDASVEFTFEA